MAAELRKEIENGVYRPGTMLPSLDEIGARFSVGKATASAAIKILEADDLVRTYQGRGTIVADRRPVAVPLSRYASVVEPGGQLGPWQTACQQAGVNGDMVMLDIGEQAAPADVAAALQIDPGTPVVRRDRHATIDGEPVQLHTAWYSAALVAGTPLAGRARVEGGVYGALTAAGHRPVTADEAVSTRAATREEAAELHLREGAAVLIVERITRDADRQPLEFLRVVATPRRTTLMYDDLPLAPSLQR
ncbi:GntR family transcriptional regulator [Streptosporangium sp. NPDC023825]|uniref:GntR family transcriptional regulator n=1 Tax=Streptosporangium sp. NPDC023825 TaxID=3154909 RepID=UPI00343B8D23